MRKQVIYFLLAFLMLNSCKKDSSEVLNDGADSKKQNAKAKSLVTISLSSNTWGGEYTSIRFEGDEYYDTVYPTKDLWGNYNTFQVPAGTYYHVYFLTEPSTGSGPYYMAYLKNGSSGMSSCVTVTGEWIDVAGVTIDGTSSNEFRVGDYCATN